MASPGSLPLEIQSASASDNHVAGPELVNGQAKSSASASKRNHPTTNNSSPQEIGQQEEVVNPPPGYVCSVAPTPSFIYNVAPNVSQSYGSSLQVSSSTVATSVSPAFLQPQVPGLPARTSPSFSYNIPNAGGVLNLRSEQQSSRDSAVSVAQETLKCASAPSISESLAQPANSTSSSAVAASASHNSGPATLRIPTVPFQSSPLMSGSPATPNPPGISSYAPLSSNPTLPCTTTDSSSFPRGILQASPLPTNQFVSRQSYSPYPSVPPVATHAHGMWLPPPQLGALPRQPFLPYPVAIPGPFPLPSLSMCLPSVPLPDAQPPGVTPLGGIAVIPNSSMAFSTQFTTNLGMQQETNSENDKKEPANCDGIKDGAVATEELDPWSAHKTEAGLVYYFNAVTGESTYTKPAGFKAEPEKVISQPTPVSWEKLTGTDWALVITNDDKRYYYNSKTKLSSWQIPTEVTEIMNKQDGDALKAKSTPEPNTNLSHEKGSAPISLSAPAVNTGGRDATALRTSAGNGPSSALDMIKKKLQDSGAPAASSPVAVLGSPVALETNGSRATELTSKGPQSENSKDRLNDEKGDGNLSDTSSDSEDVDSRPTKEECIMQFKEMLKERGVAPFSKWEKELPKIVFDPRFKAIQGYSARRTLFEHYVRTRAEEERKEKRAAQKAATEGFKQLLDEAKEDIDHNIDYQAFRKKWGHDARFGAIDRKERELLLNDRILPLKRAVQEKAQAVRAAAASSFTSLLSEKPDINTSSRWSKVKDSLREDPRYKCVKHEERETLFNEYISKLKSEEDVAKHPMRAKDEDQAKLKERERAMRKRKEREEQEVERVRSKARRKEAVESYQALLVETIKDPQASWTESKPKLEKDPQQRMLNSYLDQSDLEKLFREHVKTLHERCVHEFRALLSEVITSEVAAQEVEDGKTASTSWSTAKSLLKTDSRYAKMPRKERELLWRRHVEEMHRRRQKSYVDHQEGDKHAEVKNRRPRDYYGKYVSGSG